MPELPEVQTIVSDLNKKIKGDTIIGFWSDWKKAIKNISAKKFGEEIHDRKILRVRRIGKNIFIDLSGKSPHRNRDKKTIYIHLKMTGHLLVKFQILNSKSQINPKSKIKNLKQKADYFNDRVNQYVHHIFYLKTQNAPKNKPTGQAKLKTKNKIHDTLYKIHDTTLEFSDLRKFGKIVLVNRDKLENLKEIKNLGADALDRKFTLKKFKEILEQKSARGGSLPDGRRGALDGKKIGIILMDQNLMAGIGNIYRSEILYKAGILPTRKIKDLKSKEIENLFKSIKKILKKAVKMRGTSDSDYRDTSGAPGGFHKILKVYRREKQKCKKCGTIIKRIKLGQRSAYYCEGCQR